MSNVGTGKWHVMLKDSNSKPLSSFSFVLLNVWTFGLCPARSNHSIYIRQADQVRRFERSGVLAYIRNRRYPRFSHSRFYVCTSRSPDGIDKL